MKPREPREESLGAYLARLAPGSQCACCKGRLEAEPGPRRCGSRSGMVREVIALFCPVCGSEVSEETDGECGDFCLAARAA